MVFCVGQNSSCESASSWSTGKCDTCQRTSSSGTFYFCNCRCRPNPQKGDQIRPICWSLNSIAIYFWQANFARAVASLSKAQAKKVARFLPNPERHWGPKVRAGRQITSKHVSLLGPEAVNGHLNHENGEDSEAKRQKTEEREASMWISTECSWSCFIVLNLSWRVSHGQNMFSTDRRHPVIPASNEISKCHWSWHLLLN